MHAYKLCMTSACNLKDWHAGVGPAKNHPRILPYLGGGGERWGEEGRGRRRRGEVEERGGRGEEDCKLVVYLKS